MLEEKCEVVSRRECTTTTQQSCRTEDCTNTYQTVCDPALPLPTRAGVGARAGRQLDIPGHQQRQRTFGNFGFTGNLGAGIGLGQNNRPGISANIGGGVGLVNNKRPGIGISGNVGAGIGLGNNNRPGISGNVDAGLNINTGTLKKNSGTGAGRNCRSVLKKICVKLENEVCSAVVETGGKQCRDVPSQQCGTVERRVPRQRCVTVRERCIQTPRTQCKPVER